MDDSHLDNKTKTYLIEFIGGGRDGEILKHIGTPPKKLVGGYAIRQVRFPTDLSRAYVYEYEGE